VGAFDHLNPGLGLDFFQDHTLQLFQVRFVFHIGQCGGDQGLGLMTLAYLRQFILGLAYDVNIDEAVDPQFDTTVPMLFPRDA